MKHIIALIFVLSFTVSGCDNSVDKGFDTSLISNIERLNSPNEQLSLYRYHVESSMAFGSGFIAVTILDSKDKLDYSRRDIFSLGNSSPFWIKWKDEKNLIVKCLIDGELNENQPLKKEIKKWKDFNFEIEYYSLFSTSTVLKDTFQSYFIDKDLITFRSKSDTLVFKKNEVQFSLDTNHVYLMQFKIDTFDSKTGVSLSYYDLKSIGDYRQNDFLDQQAFLKVKP